MIQFYFSVLIFLFSFSVFGIEHPETLETEVGVRPQLGDSLDLTLLFRDSNNSVQPLKNFIIPNKPFLFIPVYYECPMICGQLLGQIVKLVNKLPFKLGQEYQIITASFSEREGADIASSRAERFRRQILADKGDPSGWKFLTADPEVIAKFTQQIGFHFKSDGKDFAHVPVFMVLTPSGAISQYFTSLNPSEWDIRLSLVEASQGLIGSPVEHFLLYCFRFDPTKGKYTWAAWNTLRAGTLVIVGLCVYMVYRSVRKA